MDASGLVASQTLSSTCAPSQHPDTRESTDDGPLTTTLAPVKLRRLHPDQAELTPEEATTGLRLGDLAPPDRPYLVLNMVATLDGRIAIDGRSGAIGDEADRELFHGLRTQADAVMVGAGTIRTERYGRMVRKPERRERRVREGLAPDPLAVVVSARLMLPEDLPLLQDEHSTVAVLTAAEGELPPTPARVLYLRGPAGAELELRPQLERLRSEHGVRSILCEGGPGLNESLLREGLVDELFLSLAPKLAGGPPLTLLSGDPLARPLELELVWLLEHEGHLFGRYRVLQDPLHA
jgi:riboflavin-specific deaminase-like protein